MNLILDTDSYKTSHYLQYPPGMTGMFSYIESRGGAYSETVFFGLQYIIKKYLSKPITIEDIDEAESVCFRHGVPFNRDGWLYILNGYDGYLPVVIKAVPEGSVVPTGNVLVTIECTDSKCFWVVSYLETILLRVWYPITVATQSRVIKKVIKKYVDKTSDNIDQLDFKLHDFGSRGVSSSESAMIGGMAHMVNFKGSDTMIALTAMREYYDDTMPAFSIPAAEHSTVTSWGEENEAQFFSHMIDTFTPGNKFVAVVSDSYDLDQALDSWCSKSIKDKIKSSGSTIVIRPDSGDPDKMVLKTIQKLELGFGSTVNKKGYKVLDKCIRVIQGDGINKDSITQILETLEWYDYAVDNITFGMGGALLQHVNRDTMKFAMKCSAIRKNGQWIGVNKNPKTDPTKASKKGLLGLFLGSNGYCTRSIDHSWSDTVVHESHAGFHYCMKTVYDNGTIKNTQNLNEIRDRAKV